MAVIGKPVLELAPGENNPRNSEGAFLDLTDGRILFVYSKFLGDCGEDDAPCCIAARYSSDGGETWTDEDRILFTREQFGARNLMSVSLLRMQDGAVGLSFIFKMGWHDTRSHLLLSYDEGETWSEKPVCMIPARGYYVTNNDRIIRTDTGRLIVPTAMHRMKRGMDFEAMAKNNTAARGSELAAVEFDGRGTAYFFYSDDDGKTWREAADCVFPPSNKLGSGLQEPGCIQLKSGTIWAYFRTDIGLQHQSFSFDNGEHWTDPAPSRFTSPCSPLSVKRLYDGRLLAVWNPTPVYQGRDLSSDGGWGGRTPLVCALSSDEGAGWTKEFYLEDGSEDAGYCYTAIHPTKDAVLLAYCAGKREDGGCLNRLRIRKISLCDLV